MNKKERGMTLIEVLAVIIILSIISILLFSILNRSNTIYHQQSINNEELNDAAYILKVLTKEIRKNSVVVVISKTELKIGNSYYVFHKNDKKITKDGKIQFSNIEDFEVTRKENMLTLKIINRQGKEHTTDLSIRE